MQCTLASNSGDEYQNNFARRLNFCTQCFCCTYLCLEVTKDNYIKFVLCNIVTIIRSPSQLFPSLVVIRGHLMTSTRMGVGGQAQVDACGWGRGSSPHVDVHTEN